MYKLHTKCRVCGSSDLESVADFGVTPLANDFRKEGEERAGLAPLNVLLCSKCALAQLSVTVNPEVLYANYSYVSSTSQTMKLHMRDLLRDIKSVRPLGHVLEIGSNTGVLLEMAKESGAIDVVGIDPAANLAEIANANGIPTTVGIFDRKTAVAAKVRADVIIARHVFAHVDNWPAFINTLDFVSWDQTLVVVEVPYVGDMLDKHEWDSVYHEHLSYVSIKSVNQLLKGTKWGLTAVKRYAIHGGSIAFFIQRRSESAAHVLDDEFTADDFSHSAAIWKERAGVMMSELIRGPRKRIFGYGAPAKATLWTSYLDMNSQVIEFVHDNTPQKDGTFMPGTDIPVTSNRERMKECCIGIIFAWNFAEEIMEREKWFTEAGGKFIVPIGPGSK